MTQMDAPFKMQCVDRKPKRRRPSAKQVPDEAAEQLAGLLPDDALQDAVRGLDASEITGPGGLITQLAGRVIEAALATELTGHLGYESGQAPPGGAPNVRSGPARSPQARRHAPLRQRRRDPTAPRMQDVRRALDPPTRPH